MDHVIDLLWAQTEPLVFITKGEFVESLRDWHIEPVEADGKLLGCFTTRGPELHFAIFDPSIPISMKIIRPRLEKIIAEHGFVRTRTPKDAARQHRFNRLIGFIADGEDEFFVHYRLEKIMDRNGRHECR